MLLDCPYALDRGTYCCIQHLVSSITNQPAGVEGEMEDGEKAGEREREGKGEGRGILSVTEIERVKRGGGD